MSDCLFDYVEQRGDRHLWICPRCGREHLSKYSDARMIHRNCTDAKPPVTEGPGTELKNLLATFWIKSQSDPLELDSCECERHVQEMNERGPDWCEENIETIVGWLRESAEKRKLPFSEFAARQPVKIAIRRARKKLAAAD